MNCEEITPLLDAFLDGELDLTASLAVEKHLATCPSCRHELEQRQELVAATKEKLPRFETSADFKSRLRASLRPEKAPEARQPWWHISLHPEWFLPGALASAAVIALAVYLPLRWQSSNSLLQEAMENHIRSLMASHIMDVASTDQHTVKPWFAGKLDYSPSVTDLASFGYPLVGGRLDMLDHRSVAAIIYQRRKHYINLFIWPGSSVQAGLDTKNGYHFLGWTENSMNYLAVSDLNEQELKDFQRMIVQSAAPPQKVQ